MNGSAATVAISLEVFDAFAALPRKEQGKVRGFVEKFRANPRHPGIHYEKIPEWGDPNLRSVRIDQAYRGVLAVREDEGCYVLLWVDHHDEAYDWGRRKRCDVNPQTGCIQVYALESPAAAAAPEAPPSGRPASSLFPQRDRELLALGVPADLLGRVRDLAFPEDLQAAREWLPPPVPDLLELLAQGEPYEDVRGLLEPLALPPSEVPDEAGGFRRALENPGTRQRFFVATDDADLAAALDEPLARWRVFLHPAQRAAAEGRRSGPFRLLGGAGTGKTVAALHRTVHLATRVFPERQDRILLTTFTRNLAADLGTSLDRICPPEARERVHVVNLDRLLGDFLREQGYPWALAYGEVREDLLRAAVRLASPEPDRPVSFYREEWEGVVLPQGLRTREAYLTARRPGRGTPLSRRGRERVWPVLDRYRRLLEEGGLREPEEAFRDGAALLGRRDLPNRPSYRAAVVDEVQDFGAGALTFLRALVSPGPDDLFLAGDPGQRIYGSPVALSRCGIPVRGRSLRLRLHYRTSEETRAFAARVLGEEPFDDLDGGREDRRGDRSLLRGPRPEVREYGSFEEEIRGIRDVLETLLSEGTREVTCLVVRKRELLRRTTEALEALGVPLRPLDSEIPDDPALPGLRVGTLHRVKGLEFDHMIVAGACEGVLPSPSVLGSSEDPRVRALLERRERSLLHVALTRARRTVLVTSPGPRSRFLG